MLQGLLCWLLLLLLPASAALAAEPPLADSPAPAARSADPDTPDPEQHQRLLQRKAQVEARINALQESPEPGPELKEAWMTLGEIAQALSLHSDAMQAWDSAWQVQRSSAGLEDPGQLPLLERLLASQRAAGEWEKADTTAHLMHHVAVRAWPPGAPERLDAVLQLGRWKLLAARDDLLPNGFSIAFQAAELYRSEIHALQEATADGAGDRIQLATLLLEKASAEYLLAQKIDEQPLQNYYAGGQRSSTMLQCQSVRLPNGSVQRICMPVEVPNIDFYVDPSNRKNQEIWSHLTAMREDIGAAFQYLSEETERSGERDLLLQDMQGLTALYNNFAGRNRAVP